MPPSAFSSNGSPAPSQRKGCAVEKQHEHEQEHEEGTPDVPGTRAAPQVIRGAALMLTLFLDPVLIDAPPCRGGPEPAPGAWPGRTGAPNRSASPSAPDGSRYFLS